jgi:hypothetical protein
MNTQNHFAMETMKREFTFLDAKRNLVEAEAEITTRNKYYEFTASGNYKNGGGQVFDHVNPANDAQKRFIDLWHEWHLNGSDNPLPENFDTELEALIDEIEELEEERKGESLIDLDDDELIELIEEETIFSGSEAHLCAALVKMFDLTDNDFDDIEIDGNRVSVQGIDYLAGTDDEMDEEWDNELDNYLEECVYPELPKNMQQYFDDEKWKRDARIDGRGHSLNRYNGDEESISVNGTYYYAYRQ